MCILYPSPRKRASEKKNKINENTNSDDNKSILLLYIQTETLACKSRKGCKKRVGRTEKLTF